MYIVREYRQSDLDGCTVCLYEGFFSCQLDNKIFEFLHDYAQVLIEKCHFTFVAEYNDIIVGFICGFYQKNFNKKLSKGIRHKKNYNIWLKMFFKYYLKLYSMPNVFRREFDCMRRVHTPPLWGVIKGMDPETNTLPKQPYPVRSAAGLVDLFFKKLRERPREGLGKDFDCELVALTSRKDYRKGLGTALVNKMMEICKSNKVKNVRLFTNTAASYKFYDKYGFKKIYKKEYEFDKVKGESIIYEFCIN